MIPCLSQGSFFIAEDCVLSHLRLAFLLCASSKTFLLERNRKTPFQMSAHNKNEFVRIVERKTLLVVLQLREWEKSIWRDASRINPKSFKCCSSQLILTMYLHINH